MGGEWSEPYRQCNNVSGGVPLAGKRDTRRPPVARLAASGLGVNQEQAQSWAHCIIILHSVEKSKDEVPARLARMHHLAMPPRDSRAWCPSCLPCGT